jgi:nitric oxide reductase NorQ protein
MRTELPPLHEPAGAQPAAGSAAPYYVPSGDEVEVFARCHAQGLAVMLKGPTGCGKTLTRAVREGALCYLDEVVEARQDTVVVLHPLTDHRRMLPIDKTGELLQATPGFGLVVSYNPGYQRMLKDLKPSTRQRFVALDFDFPPPDAEAQIVAQEGGVALGDARALVQLAVRLRALQDRGLAEVPSTRLLIAAAQLAAGGIELRRACYRAVVSPLSDEPALVGAMRDLVDATFV